MKTRSPPYCSRTRSRAHQFFHHLAPFVLLLAAARSVRSQTAGSVDEQFKSNVAVSLGDRSGYTNVDAIAVQPDGRILVAGHFAVNSQPRTGITRLNPDGAVESSATFNAVTVYGAEGVKCVAVQGDGKIPVGGQLYVDWNDLRAWGYARLYTSLSSSTPA